LDWLTFLSTDIKSLAWPAAVVIAIVVLRADITALLRTLAPRLRTAKGPWGELTFAQGVDDVEDKLPPDDTKVITEAEDTKRIGDVSELARLPPPYIVSQAWLRLEQAIREAADERPSIGPNPAPRRGYLDIGAMKGFLTDNEIGVLHELRQLRNRAAHSLDPDITITDALRYNDIADGLIQKIARHRKE
jgi:hypothetical protein